MSSLLDTLRGRLSGIDERIDTLVRSRQALNDYIEVTEGRVSPGHGEQLRGF
ncbi:hypothetical protein ACI2K4_06090 [Micromonospora sp. NPDC050397]|uniref:hypothetical protein n=1 Tax=Micromonospora sp. NPDC050397 TaxID=3364279 RepID=UPI0038510839